MKKKFSKIISDAYILFRAEMSEVFSNPVELFYFYIPFLILFFIIFLPTLILKNNDFNFIPFYFAALLNSISLQSFSNLIVGKINTGEYESFLLAPVSHLSLFITNVFTIILLFPIFFLVYLINGYQLGNFSINILGLVFVIFLILISNSGLSIILAALHLSWKRMNMFSNLLSIFIFIYCGFIVPIVAGRVGVMKSLALLIPWTHSTILILNVFQNESLFKSISSILYLLIFSFLTIIPSIRFFKIALNIVKTRGFSANF